MFPVLLIAGLYLSSPWHAWKHATITIPPWQIRGIRLVLGARCFVLGWLKIYNAYLTVGVADNFPAVMNDPLIQLFSLGTTALYQRECWVVAFAMGEIVTGFLLMTGVFCRVWCLLLIGLFTKLMVVDFGWAELPHLYFIGLFLVLLCSNSWLADKSEACPSTLLGSVYTLFGTTSFQGGSTWRTRLVSIIRWCMSSANIKTG
jgi:uncharacterized membrane protein YphA (DoxX/SURF4 family)